MDAFIALWSGDFEDHVAKHIRGDLPDPTAVPADPSNAHVDSETEASESPVTQCPAAEVPNADRVEGPVPSPPSMRPWLRPPEPAAPPKARPPMPPQQTQEHSAATGSEETAVSEAMKAYRAAEKAINHCAKESLYGPYNSIYYRVEEKVAREKEISWRERGPRGEDQPEHWKSQRWRPNGKRYANRGGRNREHFAEKYGVRSNPSSSSTGN